MMTLAGIALALVAASGLAGQALFVRLGPREHGAAVAVVVTLAVNILVFVPVAAVLRYPDYGITPVSLAAFAGAGLAGPMLGRVCFFASVHRIGASRGEVVKSSTPLLATILAVLFLEEQLTGPHLAGIVLIVTGIALVARQRPTDDEGNVDVSVLGVTLALAGAFFFGVDPIFISTGLAEGTPRLVGLSIKVITGAAGFVVYFLLRRDSEVVATLRARSLSDVKWYVAAGLSGSLFLYAYYAALEVAQVVVVVPITYMSPLIVVAVSALLFQQRERVTVPVVVSSVLVIAGGILVTVFG